MQLRVILFSIFSLACWSGLMAQRSNRKAAVNERWLLKQDSTAIDSILQHTTLRPNWLERGWSPHFQLLDLAFGNDFITGFQVKRGRKSVLMDFTFGNAFTIKTLRDIETENYLKVGVSPEFRFDVGRQRRWYVGLALPFDYTRYTNPLFGFDGMRGVRVGDINLRAVKIGLVPKIGGQFLIAHRIVIDGYLGLGASYDVLDYGVNQVISDPDVSVSNLTSFSSERFSWLPAAGIRVGWWFRN